MGEKIFFAFYSLLALILFGWMIHAYNAAPHNVMLFIPSSLMRMIGMILMFIAVLFVVLGFWKGENPTAIQNKYKKLEARAIRGIFRITRHPVMWGVIMSSISYILLKGDLATIILALSLLILALIGVYHIDYKKQILLGESWLSFSAQTSNIPFVAILSGKNKWVNAEFSITAIVLAIILYASFFIFSF